VFFSSLSINTHLHEKRTRPIGGCNLQVAGCRLLVAGQTIIIIITITVTITIIIIIVKINDENFIKTSQ